MTFDVHQLDTFVLVGSAVTLLAILAVRLSSRAGLPSLLIYLLMGVAARRAGLGIQFEDAELAHALGFARAGGDPGRGWSDDQLARDPARRCGSASRWRPSASRVSVGDRRGRRALPARAAWELAVLLGAVTSPTDAAAVFSVLRVVPLPKRLTGALEAESGLNDAPTVVLVTLVSSGAAAEHGVAGDARPDRLRARRRAPRSAWPSASAAPG